MRQNTRAGSARPGPTARQNWNRVWAGVAALVAGCATPPAPPPLPAPPAPAPTIEAPKPAVVQKAPEFTGMVSAAQSPREYRRDAATHLYAQNVGRIYQGKLPPLLYAVGVSEVDIDGSGRVTDFRWMRAPRHAPEVMEEIERAVRAAAPYPAPAKMGRVTYTDTWLWHKSGRFQLDTLTEGQL